MKFNRKILDEKYVWKIAENKFFQNFYSPPKWLSSFIFIYQFWYFHILYSFRKWNWNEISYSIENFLRVVHRLRFILLRILSGEDISDNLEMRVQIAMIFRRGNYARHSLDIDEKFTWQSASGRDSSAMHVSLSLSRA